MYRQFRSGPVFGKQGPLRGLAAVLIEHRDRTAPRGPLGVVDLPQIQHMPLHYPPVGDAAVLHHAPVAVLFAVFLAGLGSQKHAE